jgi:GT2 family glycosyltransferase
VVHWNGDDELLTLVESWPDDPRFELLVVDNSRAVQGKISDNRVFEPKENLGFGGAVNTALELVDAPAILVLNSDARPAQGALESLLEGLELHPDAAGLAPRLVSADGSTQHCWQLRPIPSLSTLLLQSLMIPAGRGPKVEPPAGTVVEQPAAAALVLRRSVLEEIEGFDEAFFPAWFEDVDLARRLKDAGRQVVYWPAATFEHGLGTTVPKLGYGRFLWIYYRNLERYLRKHHSRAMAILARLLTAAAASVRLPWLAVRTPSRATCRRDAARGLVGLLLGALTGWRLPIAFRRELLDGRRKQAPGR